MPARCCEANSFSSLLPATSGYPEVDLRIQNLHPEVDLRMRNIHPEVDLGIQDSHPEADLRWVDCPNGTNHPPGR